MSSFSDFYKIDRQQGNIVLRYRLSVNLTKNRKDQRQKLILEHRNLLNVIVSPVSSNTDNEVYSKFDKFADNKQTQLKYRMKMLQKWKEQKRRRLEEQQAKTKPIFKVCHVCSNELDDLEKIYQEIKGKPIRKNAVKSSSAKNKEKEKNSKCVQEMTNSLLPSCSNKGAIRKAEFKILNNVVNQTIDLDVFIEPKLQINQIKSRNVLKKKTHVQYRQKKE